jgi:antitoxin component YwqK of YwqJK toxin-antitoxin module
MHNIRRILVITIIVMTALFARTSLVAAQGGTQDGLYLTYANTNLITMLETYRHMQRNGIVHEYYENGNIKREPRFKDDKLNGLVKKFDKRGHLIIQIPFLAGKIDGIFRQFHPNGQVQSEIVYKDDLPNGLARYYDQKGSLIKIKKYVWGLLTDIEAVSP